MNWETLLCLGDSITLGSRSYLGYAEYCGNHLIEKTKKYWNVRNMAVAGYTTIDLVRLIDQNWASLKHLNPQIASIMIGTNDLKSETSLKDFSIAFEQLIIKTRLMLGSSNIVLNKIPPLLSGVMLPYKVKMNDQAFRYNELISNIAEKEGLLLNEMAIESDFFYDGVHLNAKGSEAWGKQLGDIILELRNE